MKLALEVGADPWITVGSANTPREWLALVSYLAAPADFDQYAARRAQHGHPEPWLDQLDALYLEVGNEWWNGIFRPFYVWPPAKYGELCTAILSAVRNHPHFDADKIHLVVGGWAINAHHWNDIVDAQCQGHDLLSIAPYLFHEGDASGIEALCRAVFADVDGYARAGGLRTREGLAKNGKGTGVAIYELNTHLAGGATPAATAGELVCSVAAGVAVLDQAMACMSCLGADPINYFTYLQRGQGQGKKHRRGLWGNLVRTLEGDHRPRPVWLGLELANRYLIDGDLVSVRTDHSPAWRQEKNGSVEANDEVSCIHAYAFRTTDAEGRAQANVLIINRSLTETLPVRVRLPFMPADTAKRVALTSGAVSDNNEEAEVVRLDEGEETGLAEQPVVHVPPFAAVVYQFCEASP